MRRGFLLRGLTSQAGVFVLSPDARDLVPRVIACL